MSYFRQMLQAAKEFRNRRYSDYYAIWAIHNLILDKYGASRTIRFFNRINARVLKKMKGLANESNNEVKS